MARRGMENRRGSSEKGLRNGGGYTNDEIFKNKMACSEFFSDNDCYIVRLNVVVLFRFENRQVFLPHSVFKGKVNNYYENHTKHKRTTCGENTDI
jgi:hypothetical protein